MLLPTASLVTLPHLVAKLGGEMRKQIAALLSLVCLLALPALRRRQIIKVATQLKCVDG